MEGYGQKHDADMVKAVVPETWVWSIGDPLILSIHVNDGRPQMSARRKISRSLSKIALLSIVDRVHLKRWIRYF